MLIGEVVKQTGLPKKTIYYYEDEKLINPKSTENGYREFSEADVIKLQTIAKLREVGVSIADIRVYFQDITQEKQILRKYEQLLLEEKIEVDERIKVCRRLIKNDISGFVKGNSMCTLSSDIVFPVEVGEKNSRKTMLIRLLSVSVVLVIVFIGLYQVIHPLILILIALISLIFMIPVMFQRNIIFEEQGFLYYQEGENSFKKNFIIPLQYLFFNTADSSRTFVPYTDIIDAEVVWVKDIFMRGWTVPKVWIAVHTKQHGTIILDVLAIEKLSQMIPTVMHIFSSRDIPIFDPHRIIGGIESGMILSTYIETLVFDK